MPQPASYGRVIPQLERRGGLHVVVLDGRERSQAVADLSDHQRWNAIEFEDLHGRAEPSEPIGGPVGGGPEAGDVPALGRDAQVLRQAQPVPSEEPLAD